MRSMRDPGFSLNDCNCNSQAISLAPTQFLRPTYAPVESVPRSVRASRIATEVVRSCSKIVPVFQQNNILCNIRIRQKLAENCNNATVDTSTTKRFDHTSDKQSRGAKKVRIRSDTPAATHKASKLQLDFTLQSTVRRSRAAVSLNTRSKRYPSVNA